MINIRHLLFKVSMPGGELAEAAHTLMGSSGMFGFQRLVAIGRSFERAVQFRADEAPALADKLRAAVEATLKEMQNVSCNIDEEAKTSQ